jgi:DNA mismatch endonuclease (patch repair protein)
MSKVGQKNTGPEMILRKNLHADGLRFRLHDKKLPGSPDLVFPRYKAAVFVHGCFWHRHGCKATTSPSSRMDFWTAKFLANIERDKNNRIKLFEMGWRVLIVWECTLKEKNSNITNISSKIKNWLLSNDQYLEI